MPRWPHASRAGFTLVEVLVALAIVAVALIAALRVAGQGANDGERYELFGKLIGPVIVGTVRDDRGHR